MNFEAANAINNEILPMVLAVIMWGLGFFLAQASTYLRMVRNNPTRAIELTPMQKQVQPLALFLLSGAMMALPLLVLGDLVVLANAAGGDWTQNDFLVASVPVGMLAICCASVGLLFAWISAAGAQVSYKPRAKTSARIGLERSLIIASVVMIIAYVGLAISLVWVFWLDPPIL